MTTVRSLSAYSAAALGVDTRGDQAGKGAREQGMRTQVQGGATDSPAVEVTALFPYQSYFDDTLLQTALLAQPSNEPIVASTLSEPIQQSGYAIGLHPSSQTPVAVRFNSGGQQGSSQTFRLVPGQVIRPYGKPGEDSGAFSGFQFGLPFGWLGGGSALLVVMRTPDSQVMWNSVPEIIFQRQRMKILAPGALPTLALAPKNWPMRFPWPNAVFGTAALTITQSGIPAIGVTPTRTAMRLRTATLAAPATMLATFVGTNDFDLSAAGTVVTSAQTGIPVFWGTWAQPAGAINFTAIYQDLILTGSLERYAADDGSLVLIDNTGTLTNMYVDVVRYGKAG